MSALWFIGHEWETELDGLPGLGNDIWTRALFVFLAVLAFLSLGAVLSLPARADRVDVVIDQVEVVIETATTTIAGDSAAPVEEVAEVVPPVGEEAVDVVDVVPPLLEEAVELVDVVPPIVDEVVAVIENIPPLVEEAIELEAVIPPIVEIVEEVLPVVEIVEDVLPVVDVIPQVIPLGLDDVVESVPPLLMDAAEVLPILVPNAFDSPGPIAIPTVPALAPTLDSPLVSLPADLTKGQPQQSAGLFTTQLVAEIAQFQLAELTGNAAGSRSSSSPVSDPETASLAGYVPITRPLPVAERGAGASAPIGSSHSGSGFLGGIDAFGLFAALAALLALCLVGWIRDRSSSGRSIFPSHGGRPG